jgi:hypothetical protein
MKKRFFSTIAVAVLAAFAIAGCANSNIDTAKVKASLEPALSATQRVDLDLALSAIQSGKYKDAWGPLRKIAMSVKLDPEQNKMLKDTMAKVQAKIDKGQ